MRPLTGPRIRWLPLVAAVLIAGCAPHAAVPADRAADQAIRDALQASAAGWNAGNLDAFLATYEDAATTTFVTPAGLQRGLGEIREIYRRSYFADGPPSTELRFESVEVTPLGRDHALAVGRWILEERADPREMRDGWFSLVWVRTPDGWRIQHDHSS